MPVSIPIMLDLVCPLFLAATHSVQLPGGSGDKSSGQREFAPVLLAWRHWRLDRTGNLSSRLTQIPIGR